MTASPTAVPQSPPSKVPSDGGNALAALFAAAAASTMQRQLSAANKKQQQNNNNNNINLRHHHQQQHQNQHHQQQQPKHQPSFASIATPTTYATKTKPTKKQPGTTPATAALSAAPIAAAATKSIVTDDVSTNNINHAAANLIASLLNGGTGKNQLSASSLNTPRSASSSSLPLTKTTATFTTTVAKQQPPTNGKPTPTTATTKSMGASAAAAVAVRTALLKQNVSTETMPNDVEMRNLETWHDEHEGQLDESCYQELVDSGNTNGWSADEMFKYNERRHKILSSYCEKTLSGIYTTPVPKMKSKTTLRMASKLAKEIEVNAAGRITPESSDDDELFERERTRRIQMKQVKQLDQLINNHKSINHSQNRHSSNHGTSTTINNHFGPPNANSYNLIANARKSNRSSSQHSNSSATPATASLSSSPTLNDSNLIMKPVVTSSSRNILRTSLI